MSVHEETMEEVDRELKDRLRKVEGQVRGIQRMIEEGRDCEEIITQLLAVRTAVDRVAGRILLTHVGDCLTRLPPDKAKVAIGRAVHLLRKVS